MVPLSLSTEWPTVRLRTGRRNGPCGSGQAACDREEARVSDHAVIGPNAPLGDVPTPAQDLEGLDVEEALRRKGEDELLYLPGGRQVRTHDTARLEDLAELLQESPGFRQIQDASVEPLTRSPDIGHVADPELEDVGNLPEDAFDVLGRLRLVLLAQLVRDNPPLLAHRPAERDRQRSRSGPGLKDTCPRAHVGVGEDRTEILGVHDLRAALHLQRVVGEPWAERDQHHPSRGLDPGPLGSSEERLVREGAGVGVVGRTRLRHEGVGAAPLIDQQGALSRLERSAHAGKASAAGLARRTSYGSWVGSGRVPRVTSTERVPPFEDARSTLTVCPGCRPARIVPTSSALDTVFPSIATMMSPSLIPA